MSGHIFFKERWFGFDDGLYSAARLLEILGVEDQSSDAVFASFPEDVSTPEINVPVTDETKFTIVEKLCLLKGHFTGGNVTTIDGLRVDFPNGWGLCRASNTMPVLVLRFEADDENVLQEIKDKFIAQLKSIDPELALNF
jgi:phosphomannomutase/phosphoglucomutase